MSGRTTTRARRIGARALHAGMVGLQVGLLATGAALPRAAFAGPEGAEVVAGDVHIEPIGNDTVIHASDGSIVNYRSFDIGAHETVQFIQPSETARVLNRIQSGLPTHVDGVLSANGRVYFVNPYGVYFGAGAEVNVAEMTAVAGHVSNEDFLAGIDRFSDLSGAVRNEGTIHADLVRLVGARVENSGEIDASGGLIALVAGDDVLLGEPGSRVYVKVGSVVDGQIVPLSESPAGAAEEPGMLLAGGDALGIAIAQSSSLRADEILVAGGEEGWVEVAGTLDASQREPGGSGGRIEITGDRIAVRSADLDASGDAGGGTVHIGGEFQGGGETPTADLVLVSPEARIRADALTRGDGGEVVVWADGATAFFGDISARGGEQGGDGGLVEVSGKETLLFRGDVDTRAPAGETGSLLLDPVNIVVRNGSSDGNDLPDLLANRLASDADVAGVLGVGDFGNLANAADPTAFQIFESELEGLSGSTNIALQASNDFTIDNLTDNILGLQTTGSVSFSAGNAFSMNTGDTIRTEGASLTVSGATVALGTLSTRGAINLLSGPINVNASGAGNLGFSGLQANTGNVSLSAPAGFIQNPTSPITGGNLSIVAGPGSGTLNLSVFLNQTNLTGRLDASSANGGIAVTETNAMSVGALDAGTGSLSLTTTAGAILDDGNDATQIRGAGLSLTSNGVNGGVGSIASNRPITATLTGTLAASATNTLTNTGIFVSQPTSTMRVAAINAAGTGANQGNIRLSSGGSILDDGVLATVVTGNNLTLSANALAATIGAQPQASNLRVTLVGALNATASNGAGGIFVTETNAMNAGAIDAGVGGSVALTTVAGSILDDGNTGTSIRATNLSLVAQGATAATRGSIGLLTTQDVASLTADAVGAINVRNTQGGVLALNSINSRGQSASGTPMAPVAGVSGGITVQNDMGGLLVNGPLSTFAGSSSNPGMGVPLATAGGSLTLDTPHTIEIVPATLSAGLNLSLNANITQIDQPGLATIFRTPDPAGGARDLTLSAPVGSIAMGQGQVLSVPGALALNAPNGSVTIGDLNAQTISINANSAAVWLRDPRAVLNQDGTPTQDSGPDIIANTTTLSLDGAMTTLGSGAPVAFATLDGLSIQNAPASALFRRVPNDTAIVPADLVGAVGTAIEGQVLDLRSGTSNTSGSTDAVAPTPYPIVRAGDQLSRLNAEAATLGGVSSIDLMAFLRCSKAPSDDPDRVSVACLGYDQTRQARAPFSTQAAAAARSDYRALAAESSALRSRIGSAWDAYRASAPAEDPSGAGFRRFLEETPEHAEALDGVRRLGDLVGELEGLQGRNAAAGGIQSWQRELLEDFTPGTMSPSLLYEASLNRGTV